ncbi:MAG: hypothetical protein LC799_04445 [Actinobacteria bacterium]|nr:hypothetical protein [Actinomycetota bacterium]
MLPNPLRRSAVTILAVLALALGATACGGGEGSQTNCSLSGCTVTFQRSGPAEVSVLGVKAKLAGVDGGNVTLDVAGQTVTVPVGGEATANGFTVRVERVTDTEVVALITA